MPPKPARPPPNKAQSQSLRTGGRTLKSLRDVYKDNCDDSGVHANSAVLQLLPDKPGIAFTSDTLNLQKNFVGNKGLIPVLHVVMRCPSLKKLILTDNGLRNAAVDRLCRVAAKHPALTSLDLSHNYISEGAARSLEDLVQENPRICEIELTNTKIDMDVRMKLREMMHKNLTARASMDREKTAAA